MKPIVALLLLVSLCSATTAEPLTVIGYNVEGGYKPGATVGKVVEYIGRAPKADIYAISELSVGWNNKLAKAMGGFKFVVSSRAISTTDALGIFYNPKRFELKAKGELPFGVHEYERPALYLHLLDKQTDKRFLVMVNHLMRGSSENPDRYAQALQLNRWVQRQRLPVVALGDYNFDYDISTSTANPSYSAMIANKHWRWVKPKKLIKTGCHKKFNSILDFVFINKKVAAARSEVLFPKRAYCKHDQYRPDHRPVMAVVSF